jgi:hypothetical protein
LWGKMGPYKATGFRGRAGLGPSAVLSVGERDLGSARFLEAFTEECGARVALVDGGRGEQYGGRGRGGDERWWREGGKLQQGPSLGRPHKKNMCQYVVNNMHNIRNIACIAWWLRTAHHYIMVLHRSVIWEKPNRLQWPTFSVSSDAFISPSQTEARNDYYYHSGLISLSGLWGETKKARYDGGGAGMSTGFAQDWAKQISLPCCHRHMFSMQGGLTFKAPCITVKTLLVGHTKVELGLNYWTSTSIYLAV